MLRNSSLLSSVSRLVGQTRRGVQTSANGASQYSNDIYVSCILERLPIVYQPTAPQKLVDLEKHFFESGKIKEFPAAKKKEVSKSSLGSEDLRPFDSVPIVTKADQSGNKKTMKRRLDERLFLLVKVKGSSGKDVWAFPTQKNTETETLRDTCERSLYATIGKQYPIFFVGNSPMGHLQRVDNGDKTFFLSAQVLEDPWDVSLGKESGAKDFAWLAKDEIKDYVTDARAMELFSKML